MSKRTKIRKTKMMVLSMGQFGTLFFWAFHGSSMSLFLNDFTDSKYMIGFVLSLAGVANCLLPVVVGNISDRTRSRFGRRRPFIVAGAIVMFCSTMALPHMPTFALVALMSGVVFLAVAFCSAPYLALMPDITPPEQIGEASGYLNFFAGIGLLAYQGIGVKIWDNYTTETIYLVALIYALSLLITAAFIKEPPVSAAKKPEPIRPLKYLGSVAKETKAIIFMVSAFFFYMGIIIIYPFVTLFLVETMQVSEGKSILALFATSVCQTLFVIPLGMLSDRINKKKFLSYTLLLLAATTPMIAFSQSLTHAIIAMGLMGFPLGAINAVGYALFLDLIPENRTAEFVGVYTFFIGLSQIVALQSAGKLIDLIGFRLVFLLGGMFIIIGFVILQFVQTPKGKALPFT